MSYNTLFGGFDGAEDRRQGIQIDLIRSIAPDVLLLQELKGFLDDGARRLFALERRLGMRAFVATALVTGQNTAVLLKPAAEILSFEHDASHFHHAAAVATFQVPGVTQPVTAVSVHLCPNGGDIRLREAKYLHAFARPDTHTVIGGDFNSIAPGDPEPDLDQLPRHHRERYLGDDGTMDRRAIASLVRAGLIDLGAAVGNNLTWTVPGASFPTSEFVPFRSDYLLASAPLAATAVDYGVVDTANAGEASDHYPVWADFDLQ